MQSDGSVVSLEEINSKFGFSPNFLNYMTVRTTVGKFVKNNCRGTVFQFVRPHVPLCTKLLLNSCSGSKTIYRVFQKNQTVTFNNELKWNSDLLLENDNNLWKTFYRVCFHCIEDNNLKWFQYRVLHRILGVRQILFKVKISDSDTCRLCGEYSETIMHLFSDCTKSTALWQNIASWINSSIKVNINLTKIEKILGYTELDLNFWPLNFVLIMTRHYIFTRAKDCRQLNIYHLQKSIHKKYIDQEILSRLNNTSSSFQECWLIWKHLFDNI